MVKKRGTKKTLMARRTPPKLDEVKLRELALAYVGRFATSRAKLRAYLNRKLRERGWSGDAAPDPEGIAESFAVQGYVDDSAYALMKSRALSGRGYGKRRVAQALRAAGIGEGDSGAANDLADQEAVSAALRFAERRRIGPFAVRSNDDPREREKAIAAGCDEFDTKPIEFDRLIAKLRRLLASNIKAQAPVRHEAT